MALIPFYSTLFFITPRQNNNTLPDVKYIVIQKRLRSPKDLQASASCRCLVDLITTNVHI